MFVEIACVCNVFLINNSLTKPPKKTPLKGIYCISLRLCQQIGGKDKYLYNT
jgi:hypothetical protein